MTRHRSGDRRSTSNKNITGSAADRRKRKQWLLDTFGDGETAKCEIRCHPDCLEFVDFDTLWVDRYPTPGVYGGKYTRDNIRPSCPVCNMSDGGKLGAERKRNDTGTGRTRYGPKTARDNLGRKTGRRMASVRLRGRGVCKTLASRGCCSRSPDLGSKHPRRYRATCSGDPTNRRMGRLTPW